MKLGDVLWNVLQNLLRYIFFIPKKYMKDENPKITEEKALEIAKQVAADEGWPWEEPIRVDWEVEKGWIGAWSVRTNLIYHGDNVIVVINAETGEVIRKGFGGY